MSNAAAGLCLTHLSARIKMLRLVCLCLTHVYVEVEEARCCVAGLFVFDSLLAARL